MLRLRQMAALQHFASVHTSLHNHFAQERHLVDRTTSKERRSAALAEWQMLAAGGRQLMSRHLPSGDWFAED